MLVQTSNQSQRTQANITYLGVTPSGNASYYRLLRNAQPISVRIYSKERAGRKVHFPNHRMRTDHSTAWVADAAVNQLECISACLLAYRHGFSV